MGLAIRENFCVSNMVEFDNNISSLQHNTNSLTTSNSPCAYIDGGGGGGEGAVIIRRI